ncbi:hypothetical protein NQ315_000768 [Exocentrus adspersus]|uniref:Rrn7/TAF1B C-terminal cyclin domain-containing protein n=1 Tax=Exocentrus adspersus TaxID=1586481 RepID=A0AAV8WE50_9CUCU|nr:hypothetical protein NQ315_000768 [Exocentrus adspersus]
MECETCGATNFYNESGYFICKECNTQSQEVGQHLMFDAEVTQVKGLRKQKKEQKENLDSKITSWECYNIVMCSLTNQLIDLGADKTLKPIVKCLWMRYLHKLEVFDLKKNAKPRLQLVNSKRDLNIVYGVEPKKPKRKKSEASSDSSVSRSSRRDQSRRKRAMFKTDLEDVSKQSTPATSSLHNETLTSLKSPSEKSEKTNEPLYFNRYGNKELKNKLTYRHYRKHKLDTRQTLKCHKLTYSNCSEKYKNSIYFLSPIKLYCILYLGLLINRDEIQLGDLFRFIREGHLSFNSYIELFPEEYMDKFLNIQNNSKNSLFSNHCFRTTAAKIAVFLKVTPYIKSVDLTALCKRYCTEMNLPDSVYETVVNMISKTSPKLTFSCNSKSIPNYEGRAMSIIMFILKLLFGLDGVTELEISKYAQSLNNLNINIPKMFDIMKWLEYVCYRRLMISEHHFPSAYLNDSEEVDSDLFLKYINSQEIKYNENLKLNREMQSYKELLSKHVKDHSDVSFKFEPSLTPFTDYSKTLKSPKPNQYLDLVSSDLQVKNGGANDNWVIQELQTYSTLNILTDLNRKLIPVEITKGVSENIDDEVCSKKKPPNKKLDPRYIQKTHNKCLQHVFRENEIYVKRVSKQVDIDIDSDGDDEVLKPSTYNNHYNPYERYWLHLQGHINLINKTDFDAHYSKFTGNFKLIFNECARTIEQNAQELLLEFQFTELFLVYSATYHAKNCETKKMQLVHKRLRCFIDQANRLW